MEDQGKRLMLAAALAFGIMIAWSQIFPPEKPADKDNKDESGQVEKVGNTAAADSATADLATAEDKLVELAAPLPRGEEVFYDFNFNNLQVRFSSYGGALRSWKLLSTRLEDRSSSPYKPDDLIRVKNPDYQFLRVWFPESTFDIPQGAEWKGEKVSAENLMRFTWESSDIKVVKEITIHPADYSLVMKVSLELAGAKTAKQSLAVSLFSEQDPNVEEAGMFDRVSREWLASCYYNDELFTKSSKSLLKDGEKKQTGQINWGGFDHAYFLTAGAIAGAENLRIECNAYALRGVEGGMGIDLIQASTELKAGEPGLKSTIAFFLGPKYLNKLRKTDEISGIKTNLEKSVDFGWFGIIASPLLSLLNFFQSLVGNWGLAILLLTIVVKALTLPWTHKSLKSMKSMAKLKPELEKIKVKYKDDRAKQNVETMALFKTHKVNPMSGCLPMLLQMPIWFALYRALTVAAELYQAPFIPGWIDDLTLPDPYYIMPILLMGMMFLQTRMTPSTGTGAQQKMLQYGMPIMFGVMSFFFPSGLTLYIFTNTCFTALHHLYMHKTDPAPIVSAVSSDKVIDVEEAKEEKEETKAAKIPTSNNLKSSSKKKKSGKGKKNRKH